MFQELIPTITQLDPRLLTILAVGAFILFIVSILKKAIKAGIVLLLLAILLGGSVPTINRLKESYGIKYDKITETLALKVDGKTITLPMKEIKEAKKYSIDFNRGGSKTKVSLFYQQADGITVSEGNIEIPNFMVDTVQKYLRASDLAFTTEVVGALP